MRRGALAHLEVQGKPACTRPWLMRKAGLVKCSYPSIAAARRAKLELQKHAWAVRVVRGACPTIEGGATD